PALDRAAPKGGPGAETRLRRRQDDAARQNVAPVSRTAGGEIAGPVSTRHAALRNRTYKQQLGPNGLWRPSETRATVPHLRERLDLMTKPTRVELGIFRGGGALSAQAEKARPSTVAELLETDEAKGLLESARQTGSLNATDIALALDELELDAAQIDDFYHALDELQIEVLENGAQPEVAAVEPEPEVREISTDSLQLFVKDVGKV